MFFLVKDESSFDCSAVTVRMTFFIWRYAAPNVTTLISYYNTPYQPCKVLTFTMRRFTHSPPPGASHRFPSSKGRYDIDGDEVHYPTRPVDKDKAEQELTINIKKATSPEEAAPKQKHVRSEWP